MRRTALLGVVLVPLLCSAGAERLCAQSAQPFSVQFSALGAALGGEAFEPLKRGYGFEAQLRYSPSALSIGGGAQYTTHKLKDLPDEDFSVDLWGAFIEPRYVIDIRSNNFAPYLSARFAYSMLETSDSTTTASGVTVNGGGGILVRLSPKVNLDLGATYGYTRWGDLVVDPGDGSEPETFDFGSGTNLIARVGLAIGLGH